MVQEFYTTGETASILKVSTKTIQNWDKKGEFVPAQRASNDRLYSRQQIEDRLGMTIENATNPILSLDADGIEALRASIDEFELVDLQNQAGYTIKEKYETVFCKIVHTSAAMYRKNGRSPANFILTSPEMATVFETATAGFAPAWDHYGSSHLDSIVTMNRVRYIGIINQRWAIYSSLLMPENEFIMGIRDRAEMLSGWGTRKGFFVTGL